jgi:hypothetical protein
MEHIMTDQFDSASPVDQVPAGFRLHHHSGIGFTEWMAFGLVVFTILLVILAVVINLFLGTPGGLASLHSAAPL